MMQEFMHDIQSEHRVRLTRKEEGELARRAQAGDLAARNEMVASVLPLMVKEAAKFASRCPEREQEDLTQVCALAAMQAALNFDPALGYRYTTYAVTAMRRWMRGRRDDTPLVRVPGEAVTRSVAMNRCAIRLGSALGRRPNSEELQAAMQIARPKLFERIRQALLAVNAVSPGETEAAQATLAQLPASPIDREDDDLDRLRAHLSQWLERLTFRERLVIRGRFFEGRTLKEVGEQLECTRERVRQIEAQALGRLRRFARERSV